MLGLGEDELLWLTVRLAEAARQVDPGLELIVGIAQPWGEYMALQDHTHSPFIFADTLIRSGMNLAGLDVELVLGVSPRGSYCRDPLEVSRLIDLYALLGRAAARDARLSLRRGYRCPRRPGACGDRGLAGAAVSRRKCRRTGPIRTSAWRCASRPSAAVTWTHFLDGAPHQFPACGLVDAKGKPKPALARVQELREKHLR